MKIGIQRQGFALVVVLSVLVLLVILAVGFLARSVTERSAASGFRASVVARQYADTAVSVVQGQINLATIQGSSVSWASQPGMVRTFNTSGTLVRAYKLYSANDMITDKVDITNGKSGDEPPVTWSTDTATWTDLNAPVEVSGTKIYPILDPTGAGTNLADDSDNTIAEGFSIGTVPGSTTYQPIPMPVRWLYVLKDGTLVAASGNGTTTTINGETKDNPVVGRVGFWTDDDTCKVNINTASVGTYWDTPHGASTQEINFAKYQPVQREWQRYPGHPAMTNLSAVFPAPAGMTAAQWADEIYKIVPKVVGGGSNEGTSLGSGALTPDSDRLYANVDEMALKPDRTLNSSLSKAKIEQARFFLTAHSRAPETNLFNLPRIACWPVYRLLNTGLPNLTRTSAFDRLIAFCSTVNGQPYFFQREVASSISNDINITRNTQLYKYLQYLTAQPIPGFGGDFSTKYADDRDQILTEIFDYIRSENMQDDLLASNMRYTPTNDVAGMGWVAPTRYDPGTGKITLGLGRSYTISELALGVICNAAADDPTTTGVDESAGSNNPAVNPVLGGTPLATGERYIQSILTPEFFSAMQGWVSLAPFLRVKMKGLDSIKASIGGTVYSLFPNLDNEVAQVVASKSTMITNWGGNPSYRLFGQGMGSPARGNIPASSNTVLYPFIGTPLKITVPSDGQMTVKSGGAITVEIYSGTSGALDATTLIQTIDISIPTDFVMPLPKIMDSSLGSGTSLADKTTWWSFSGTGLLPGRLSTIGQNVNGGGRFFLENYDSVRSFIPKHGDYRLIGGNATVPSSEFVLHPYASDPTRRIAASLASTDSSGWMPGTDTRGSYIQGVTYPANFGPDMPYLDAGSSYWPSKTGDFDTGISVANDGPYINKPDEGNILSVSSGSVPYFDTAYQTAAGGTAFFSPNRQMPSPGMFGSLPSGVKAGVPWRTLLFRPQDGHFGATSPADHLLLDLFWMPVVEPYAVSDRFSTAGKINLNYQILPFTYITRATGLRALLDSEKMAAIPITSVSTYKPNTRTSWLSIAATNPSFRLDINPSETLSQFQTRFNGGDIFKSASEICSIHIVPTGKTLSDMTGSFWQTYALTGDNLRERIYTTLYPRLTTKSNTYTVHFRAQALKKLSASPIGTWTEGKDQVTGEYRGSTTIERFIDANNTNIPDYASTPSSIPSMNTLDKFYRWHVVENRQFAP